MAESKQAVNLRKDSKPRQLGWKFCSVRLPSCLVTPESVCSSRAQPRRISSLAVKVGLSSSRLSLRHCAFVHLVSAGQRVPNRGSWRTSSAQRLFVACSPKPTNSWHVAKRGFRIAREERKKQTCSPIGKTRIYTLGSNPNSVSQEQRPAHIVAVSRLRGRPQRRQTNPWVEPHSLVARRVSLFGTSYKLSRMSSWESEHLSYLSDCSRPSVTR